MVRQNSGYFTRHNRTMNDAVDQTAREQEESGEMKPHHQCGNPSQRAVDFVEAVERIDVITQADGGRDCTNCCHQTAGRNQIVTNLY